MKQTMLFFALVSIPAVLLCSSAKADAACGDSEAATAAVAYAAGDETPIGSRFYVRLDAGGSVHPSDQNLETNWYPWGPDLVDITDRELMLMYHFDQKFGAFVSGAAGYRLTKALQCELGLGYTTYSVRNIDQNGRRRALQLDIPAQWTDHFPDASSPDASSFNLRPAIKIKPSWSGKIIPYVGAGLDIYFLSISGSLIYELPNSAADFNPELVQLRYDGSETLFGGDIASGFEVMFRESLALDVGVSYLFMQKAFSDFHEIIVDPELALDFEREGYAFDGISFSGLRAGIGIVWYP